MGIIDSSEGWRQEGGVRPWRWREPGAEKESGRNILLSSKALSPVPLTGSTNGKQYGARSS